MENSMFFGLSLTLAAYWAGTRIYARTRLPLLHPILTSAVMIAAVLLLLNIDYKVYNIGASHISFFLTPVTIALAVPLYKQINQLKKNLPAVLVSVVIGTSCGLLSIIGMALAFGLDREILLSLLGKSVTTPISVGIAAKLGGIEGIAVAATVITGITGAVIAEATLKFLGITHPVAKGLAIGTSAHAVGTSKAIELGRLEGAISGISIVIAGLTTVLLAPLAAKLI
ncbi:MAG: LrgB family protein [Rickettsiales bacterium]|nr:LrgB family protein [Rickettsiales bacterium]